VLLQSSEVKNLANTTDFVTFVYKEQIFSSRSLLHLPELNVTIHFNYKTEYKSRKCPLWSMVA